MFLLFASVTYTTSFPLVCPLSALSLSLFLSLIFSLESGSFTLHSDVLLFLRLPQLFVILPSISRSPLSLVKSSTVHTSLFNFPFSTVSQTIELCSVGAETFTLFSFKPSVLFFLLFSGLTKLYHGNWVFLQPWALVLALWTFRK